MELLQVCPPQVCCLTDEEENFEETELQRRGYRESGNLNAHVQFAHLQIEKDLWKLFGWRRLGKQK